MGRFRFRQFSVADDRSAMKTGTDGVLLGAWAEAPEGVRSIVDIGCGAGVIALMMAQRYPSAMVTGVEIDPGAAADARDNIASSLWADRVSVVEADATVWNPAELPAPRLIVSNPPFFSEALRSPDAERALARHGDTLTPVTLIAAASRLMTSADDRLAFISPADRDEEIEFALAMARLHPLRRCAVTSREGKAPYRTLWLASPVATLCSCGSLAIRDVSNTYTREYSDLTGDFYL